MTITSLLFLSLLSPTISLHVFLSGPGPRITTKQTFSLEIQGDDCPYDPCYFSVEASTVVLATGLYENTPLSVDLSVSTAGQSKLLVMFSDSNGDSELPYGATDDGGFPLVFVLPMEVQKSEYCNSVRFSVDGTEASGLVFLDETELEIDVFNGFKDKITAQYFYSGILSPTVQFTNTTSQFYHPVLRNTTTESWTLQLDKGTLMTRLQNDSLVPQQDWDLVVSFPNVYVESCSIQKAVFSVSLLSSVFTDSSKYFGDALAPVFDDDVILQSRHSPCSRNVHVVFQKNSEYFGIYLYDSVKWYRVPDVDGEPSSLLEVVLLPEGAILMTSRGVVSVREGGSSVKLRTITRASVEGTVRCPTVCSDRVLITLNQDTVLSSTCPYTDWDTLSITADTDCKILNTYHDMIRDVTIVTQQCEDSVVITGQDDEFQSDISGITTVSGVHWNYLTSDVYLYGSHILHSASRGRNYTTLLTLEQDELVREVLSGAFSGDIIALTDTGRVFVSNVGIDRFVEVHNVHSSPLTLHSFYTLDHTSRLYYHTLASPSITRYGIPRRSLFSSEFKTESPLYVEPVGGNKIRIISSAESDTFKTEDVGKIFQLCEGRGAGRIVDVSQITRSVATLSAALLEITEPFVTAKTDPNGLTVDGPDNDGVYTIGFIGDGEWRSRDVGSCIVVLYCTSFLVTGTVTSTSLEAIPLHPNKAANCLGLVESNRWFAVNLDPFRSKLDLPLGDEYKFTVTSISGQEITMSTPSSVTSALVGSVVTFGKTKHGVVQSVTEGEIMLWSDQEFDVSEEFASWEVVFANPGSGMFAEGYYPRDLSWSVSEPSCEVAFMADDLSFLSHPVPRLTSHVDTWNEVELKAKVSDRRKFPTSPPNFKILFDNRDKFQFYSTYNTTSHLTELAVHMRHERLVGGTATPLSITPTLSSSLMCEVPSLIYTVRQDCDPQTRILLRYPHVNDHTAFLSPDFRDSNGEKLMTTLPVNYRPPSVHGREISTSPNVYNVDPSVTVPRSDKTVSKDSYTFKQCTGAGDATECACSDEKRTSDLAVDSDCRQTVYTVPYTTVFSPEIFVVRFGQNSRPLNNSYLITEVNGREEYQIYGPHQRLLPSNCNFTNCSIVFLGSELYHFRITVVSGTICIHETEFLLYVVDVPLTTTLHNTITVHVGSMMFIIILIYYNYTKGVESERNLKEEYIKSTSEHSSSASSCLLTKDTKL